MATKATSAKANGRADVSVDDLTQQIDTLKNDIAELAGQLKTFGEGKASEASAAAKSAARDAADRSAEKLHETQKQAEDFVRTQPGTALGIAAGVGFLVGFLTSRR